MKAKLAVTVLLSLGCVLLLFAGIGHVRADGYAIYLPIVASYCEHPTSAYASADSPIVRVGETVTVTGVLFNDCTRLVGLPAFIVRPEQTDILSPTVSGSIDGTSVPVGEYRIFTATFQAVSTGPVTFVSYMIYESQHDDPPVFYWTGVYADPINIRVVP